MKIHNGDLTDDEQLMKQLEHFMYGYNYQVTYGFEILYGIKTIEETKKQIKKIFNDADVDKITNSNITEFWELIENALTYRGDDSSGLKLDKDQELNLQILQNRYREFLKKYIKENSEIIQFLDYRGFPGYPVWWDYYFALINNDGNSIFVYGASSD
jgi:hypothetical protein